MINLPSAFFVAGTDTEVGKTYVSVQLINLLVNRGQRVGVMKPVSAGCELIDGQLRNADALSLMQASNLQQSYEEVNPFAYSEPVSPHIAAQGAPVCLDVIAQKYKDIRASSDCVVVEGAGGWMTPISAELSMVDLVKALHIPVVLVVAIKLGCLNHAMLTVDGIKKSGIHLAGWVANEMDPAMSYLQENIQYLKPAIDAPLINISAG